MLQQNETEKSHRNIYTVTLNIEVPGNMPPMRLDQALPLLVPTYSRSQWQTWIKAGKITVNDQIQIKTRYTISPGDRIHVSTSITPKENWSAQDISFPIVYEDQDMLVVNKPAGLTVHPGAGQSDQTLVNALLHYDPSLAHIPRAGLIHRLDKDTSGLLLIAKTPLAYQKLISAMKERLIKRTYETIVLGVLKRPGHVDKPIGRDSVHRTRMSISPLGRPAITHYETIENFSHYTHLRVNLETGRTHQIRVHMTFLKHPIVGDPIYGRSIAQPARLPEFLKETIRNFPRQALHAIQLELSHPISEEPLRFQAPLPSDMQMLLEALREYD